MTDKGSVEGREIRVYISVLSMNELDGVARLKEAYGDEDVYILGGNEKKGVCLFLSAEDVGEVATRLGFRDDEPNVAGAVFSVNGQLAGYET